LRKEFLNHFEFLATEINKTFFRLNEQNNKKKENISYFYFLKNIISGNKISHEFFEKYLMRESLLIDLMNSYI
jgi:hypothetical protein